MQKLEIYATKGNATIGDYLARFGPSIQEEGETAKERYQNALRELLTGLLCFSHRKGSNLDWLHALQHAEQAWEAMTAEARLEDEMKERLEKQLHLLQVLETQLLMGGQKDNALVLRDIRKALSPEGE